MDVADQFCVEVGITVGIRVVVGADGVADGAGVHAEKTTARVMRVIFLATRESLILDMSDELSHLTACVTCAGAGTAKPSSQKNDKA